MQTQRALIKWNIWIDSSTPIPTLTTLPGIPGLYEGAQYCDNGLFRPTYNSKMRSLGVPFEQINTEQLIKRIYNLVSPLDDSTPVSSDVSLAQGQRQVFDVATPAPLTHALMVTWFVDGQPQGTESIFTLETTTLAVGSHTVEVVVEDTTTMVLNDPGQLLIEHRIWNVTVTPPDTTPRVLKTR